MAVFTSGEFEVNQKPVHVEGSGRPAKTRSAGLSGLDQQVYVWSRIGASESVTSLGCKVKPKEGSG